MAVDEQVIAKLRELIDAIAAYPDPRRASTEWKAVLTQLRKTPLDANHVANVVARRGLEDLKKLVGEISAAAAPADAQPPLPEGVTEAMLKGAIKSFKRRLKLIRLDEESGLNSRNPLSGGVRSQTDAIQPPGDYPREVWHALVQRGRLRDVGGGFYQLTHEDAEH